MEYALIGETGPLEDFDHWRQLLDFAGLNIRERKSGEYEGEKKITKKGRSRLRKVLSRMAFVLVVRKRLYADYYKRKLESGMCTPELGELWVGVIPPPPRPDW